MCGTASRTGAGSVESDGPGISCGSGCGESYPPGRLVTLTAGPAVYLALAGAGTAWFLYLRRPDIPDAIAAKLSAFYNLLDRKYYFDDLYIKGFAAGGRRFGDFRPFRLDRKT